MKTFRQVVDAFFNLDEAKTALGLFLKILASPATTTMDLVDRNATKPNPFKFWAFGTSVVSVVNLSEPLIGHEVSWVEGIFQTIVQILSFFLFFAIAYWIFKRVAESSRSLHQYYQMGAYFQGTSALLTGAASAVTLVQPVVGFVALIAAAAYTLLYNFRVMKRFWELSYPKIIGFSMLSGVVTMIPITMIILCLAPLMGLDKNLANFSEPLDENVPAHDEFSKGYNEPSPYQVDIANNSFTDSSFDGMLSSGNFGTESNYPSVPEFFGTQQVSWWANGVQYAGLIEMNGSSGSCAITFYNPYGQPITVHQSLQCVAQGSMLALIGSNPTINGYPAGATYSPDNFIVQSYPSGDWTPIEIFDASGVRTTLVAKQLDQGRTKRW